MTNIVLGLLAKSNKTDATTSAKKKLFKLPSLICMTLFYQMVRFVCVYFYSKLYKRKTTFEPTTSAIQLQKYIRFCVEANVAIV